MSEESHPRTLYVGNLDATVTEDLLATLFAQIGAVKSCKVIREPGNDPYAFIEFVTHNAAATALAAMNKRHFLEKEMKVNWATSPGNTPKTDTSNHYHIFVGDLSPEIETHALREAFAPFGEISNCRIVRDPQTLKSKGYAFVSFVKKAEAESAINAMNGQWLGNRSIRTNWSTRKPPPPRSVAMRQSSTNKTITYDEVYNQSSPTNCTVYCGGFTNGMSEELMHSIFSQYGTIVDIRAFKDKGYAFIKFSNKESATRAIEGVHNTEIHGQAVKCFWGKESGDPNASQPGVPSNGPSSNSSSSGMQYPYNMYNQQMSYWYPPVQQNYYTQQGYGYGGQQYGYQPGYVGRMNVQMPGNSNTAWSNMQSQNSVSGNSSPVSSNASQGGNSAQSAAIMYSMQQFQSQ